MQAGAITYNHQRRSHHNGNSPFMRLFLALLVLVGGTYTALGVVSPVPLWQEADWQTVLVMAAVQLNFHSILRHSADAESVKRCLYSQGPIKIGWNGDKKFEICFIEPFKYGIHITVHKGNGIWNEVTSFIFNKGDGAVLDEVIAYLQKTGVIFK